jgi:hypothetical protein
MAFVQRPHGRHQADGPASATMLGNRTPQIGNSPHDGQRFHAVRLDTIFLQWEDLERAKGFEPSTPTLARIMTKLTP